MRRLTGLDATTRACHFDLDGVLVETRDLHYRAWKKVFDQFFDRWSASTGLPIEPFDRVGDFEGLLDGRSRANGAEAVLRDRGMFAADSEKASGWVREICDAKGELIGQYVDAGLIRAYPATIPYLTILRGEGIRITVVSSSIHAERVLETADLTSYIDVLVSPAVSDNGRPSFPSKPAPDMYLAAIAASKVDPNDSAAFEDSVDGVRAASAAGLRSVIGIDRARRGKALIDAGAHRVIRDLGEMYT